MKTSIATLLMICTFGMTSTSVFAQTTLEQKLARDQKAQLEKKKIVLAVGVSGGAVAAVGMFYGGAIQKKYAEIKYLIDLSKIYPDGMKNPLAKNDWRVAELKAAEAKSIRIGKMIKYGSVIPAIVAAVSIGEILTMEEDPSVGNAPVHSSKSVETPQTGASSSDSSVKGAR